MTSEREGEIWRRTNLLPCALAMTYEERASTMIVTPCVQLCFLRLLQQLHCVFAHFFTQLPMCVCVTVCHGFLKRSQRREWIAQTSTASPGQVRPEKCSRFSSLASASSPAAQFRRVSQSDGAGGSIWVPEIKLEGAGLDRAQQQDPARVHGSDTRKAGREARAEARG